VSAWWQGFTGKGASEITKRRDPADPTQQSRFTKAVPRPSLGTNLAEGSDVDQGNTDCEISRVTVLGGYVKSDVENRAARKVAGICVRRCCRKPAADDSLYCPRHADAQRRYHTSYMKRRRAEWLRDGCCTNCGAAKRKRGSAWCVACAIRDDRVPLSSVKPQVENHRDRVVAGTRVSTHVSDVGRVRYHGQGKRGAPSSEAGDRNDLGDMRRILERYSVALEAAYGAEVAELTPMQRDDARRAAYAWLALAVRTGGETLRRHRLVQPEMIEPDEKARR